MKRIQSKYTNFQLEMYRMLQILATVAMFVILMSLMGCARVEFKQVQGPQGSPGVSLPAPTLATAPATISQCPAGGLQIESTAYDPTGASVMTVLGVICDGQQGAVGQTGSVGESGTSCSVTQIEPSVDILPNGGAEVTCGSSSALLSNGSDGAPGVNAVSVTPVQFCPQYTTSYSSSFPEFGLKVGANIFAVYWDGKNAWLAEVVPGYYASTSTSAPCNFTVNSNGTISN